MTENTPALKTERLILRQFTRDDLEALFTIYSDREVNTFLPWYPLSSMEEAEAFFEERYAEPYRQPQGYRYAICLRKDNIPIGYIHTNVTEDHDFGYGLRKDFWRQGIATEAGTALLQRLREDGIPYITATHDRNNPRSGGVMKRLGMRYQYSYEEQWQPKDFPVTFRMYQLNLDGQDERVYRKYWEKYPIHFVEKDV
mgnify:CR=1 FL=1